TFFRFGNVLKKDLQHVLAVCGQPGAADVRCRLRYLSVPCLSRKRWRCVSNQGNRDRRYYRFEPVTTSAAAAAALHSLSIYPPAAVLRSAARRPRSRTIGRAREDEREPVEEGASEGRPVRGRTGVERQRTITPGKPGRLPSGVGAREPSANRSE